MALYAAIPALVPVIIVAGTACWPVLLLGLPRLSPAVAAATLGAASASSGVGAAAGGTAAAKLPLLRLPLLLREKKPFAVGAFAAVVQAVLEE